MSASSDEIRNSHLAKMRSLFDPTSNINASITPSNNTTFQETLTAQRTSQFNLKPTYGISTLRYSISNTGTGATSAETNGEFRLQSGTANNGLSQIQTNQRGLYSAGTMGQAGIGIRIPVLPLTSAFAEWGYTDFTNGFYFGVDGTGKYIAIVSGGSVTKTYQSSWNVDKLDGTGKSGLTLDLSNGVITQINFTWYGYGLIEFFYYVKNTSKVTRVNCHTINISSSTSIIDPNQPLSFRVGNGASTTTDVSLYVGGHQFSVITGNSTSQSRNVGELVTNYTTVLNTNWQPIISMRKKANFNSRTNSVTAFFNKYSVSASGDLELRVTVNGVTNNLSFASPTGWTSTESSIETKITGGTALTTSSDGEPFLYSFCLAAGSGSNTVGQSSAETDFALGANQEIILWVRRLSASGSVVIKHANIEWLEIW